LLKKNKTQKIEPAAKKDLDEMRIRLYKLQEQTSKNKHAISLELENVQKTIHNVFFELRMIRSDLPTSDKELAFTEKLKGKNNSSSKADQENVVLKAFKHRLAQKNSALKEEQARRNAPI
jgi:hypothetical protein